jgi:hypothetical protein
MSPWIHKSKLSKLEVAQILQDFLDGTGKPNTWDGFTLGMSFEDDYLDRIRTRCARLSGEFPPAVSSEYCGEQGREVIRNYIRELRNSGQSIAPAK